MLKVLRKHNKWFMVVFGTLLMLTFLIDRGARGAKDAGKRVVAETKDGSILARDLQLAEAEVHVLSSICPMTLKMQLGIDSGMHWLLLTRQAERMGLVGDQQDGETWIPQLAQTEVFMRRTVELTRQYGESFARQILNMQAAQLMNEAQQYADVMRSRRDAVAKERGFTEQASGVALAKLRGVERMSRLYGGAATPSDRQAIFQFRREADSIIVGGVVIPAEAIASTMPEATPERLKAHFETYAKVKPGTGDLGFGYLLEPRLRIEWIRLSREEIGKSIQIDPIEVNKHWQLNRTKFPGEYDAEQAAVEKALRDSKIDAVLSTASRVMKDRVRASLSRLPIDGPYRRLPTTWAQDCPSLDLLAQEIADACRTGTGVSITKPAVEHSLPEFVELSKAGSLSGIGESFFRAGQSGLRFEQLVGMCREIQAQTTLDLQAGVPFATVVLENTAGDNFYFNILEVKPEAAPASLDEVRTRVVDDLKKFDAFEKLKNDVELHRTLAATADLKTLAAAFKKPGSPAEAPLPLETFDNIKVTSAAVSRQDLNTDEVKAAVRAAAAKLGPLFTVSAANQADRTVAVPLPKSFAVAVLQLTGEDPIVVEDLRTLNAMVADQMATAELVQIQRENNLDSPIAYDVVKEAAGLKEVGVAPKKEPASKSETKPATTTK